MPPLPPAPDGAASTKPQLKRYPDARRGRWRLVPSALLGYFGLFLGPGVAGLLGVANGLALRRYGLAAGAFAIGAVSWVVCPIAAVLVARAAGIDSLGFVLLMSRLLGAVTGIWLALRSSPHVRGHVFLRGRTFPVLEPVLAATVLSFVIPARFILIVSGFWPLLLQR
jgi:hypothetical protein